MAADCFITQFSQQFINIRKFTTLACRTSKASKHLLIWRPHGVCLCTPGKLTPQGKGLLQFVSALLTPLGIGVMKSHCCEVRAMFREILWKIFLRKMKQIFLVESVCPKIRLEIFKRIFFPLRKNGKITLITQISCSAALSFLQLCKF